MFVWEWRTMTRLHVWKAGKVGVPPQIYGIKWNPVERPDLKGKYPDNKDCAFVTFGSKHLYFWSTNGSKDGRPINTELTGVGTCVLRDGEAIKG